MVTHSEDLKCAILPLTSDGTFRQIFESTGFALEDIALTSRLQAQAFRQEYKNSLLGEGHGTFVLLAEPGHAMVVICMENDGYPDSVHPFDHTYEWKAIDTHQYALRMQ